MEPYELIEDHEKVIGHFGQWPSFHDGEVHRIVLDRMNRSASGSYTPTAEVHLRGWVMTADVNAGGLFKVENDAVIHFLFEGVFDFELEGFNQQNVLSSLNFSIISDSLKNEQALHVELEHCYLFSSEFSARKAKVLKVVPYVEEQDG